MALKKDVFFFLPCKQDTPRIVIEIVTLYEAVTTLHYLAVSSLPHLLNRQIQIQLCQRHTNE